MEAESWIPNSLTIEKIISTALLSIPGSLIKWLGYKKRHVQLCRHFLTIFTPMFPQTLVLMCEERKLASAGLILPKMT